LAVKKPGNVTHEEACSFPVVFITIYHALEKAMFKEGEKILAVVNAEGEDDGEAFFQIAHEDLARDILQEMFSFCEAHLGKEKGGGRVIYLRIPSESKQVKEIAMNWGYVQGPEKEEIS
jgi:NADPH:quinone reductase-like Zn-dependent oxidoreductase